MTVYARRAALGLMASALVAAIAAPAAAQINIEIGMPAPLVEVVPAAPHPGWHWVPGHYAWRYNHWAWIRGHYVAWEVPPMPALIVEAPPPNPGPRWFWVKGHYVFEGRGWVWHRGMWVRR